MAASLLKLPAGFEHAPRVLAMGAELKSSLCLLEGGMAHRIYESGDLEEEQVLRDYCAQLTTLGATARPAAIALDMHPDYLSTQQGWRLADEWQIAAHPVQHHHAHIAACMAEHGLPLESAPVLGVAMDGLGFGDDGGLWGAEFLLADYAGFKRLASFEPMPMPGGAKAVHEPWRNTFAYLSAKDWEQLQADFADTDIIRFLQRQPLPMLDAMIRRGINSPKASSCGRLFDAVAAALGLHREQIAFEAQAAVALEKLATSCIEKTVARYPTTTVQTDANMVYLSWLPMWPALLADLASGVDASLIAARFHHTVAAATADMIGMLCDRHGIGRVVLSGGVFQNRLLQRELIPTLQNAGQTVLSHNTLPTHDGGIAVGQAMVTAARLLKEQAR